MKPKLALTGRLDSAPGKLTRTEKRDWLARAAVWFEMVGEAVLAAELTSCNEDKPVLYVSYHPSAEDVEVRLSPSGVVRVTAETWPVGPGYHAYLCAGLNSLAENLGITWEHTEDTTGFIRSADPAALSGQFHATLRGVCRELLLRRGGAAALGLPTDHGFTHPGPVLTPLGPRSWEWVTATAADPTNEVDVFPWWSPDLDAEFFCNRAAAHLWCDYPWRRPLTEDEGELTDQIAADLEMAYSLDPTAELPWREWAEVLAAIEEDRGEFTVQAPELDLKLEIQQRAAQCDPTQALIGYRRHPIRIAVAGWSVEVPGSFADGWEGDRMWVGWHGDRRVTLRVDEPGPMREPTFIQGRHGWRLACSLSVGVKSLNCEIEMADLTDRDWAGAVWRSLRYEGAAESKSSVA